MSFSLNGITANPPTGSIAPYLGTNNPPGWVICNGVEQGSGSDGRYNNLINMLIGTGTLNGNYTPPNFRGAFLRGTGTSNINAVYTGPSLKTAQDMASLAHTHTGDSHTHNTVNGGTTCYAVPLGGNNAVTTAAVDNGGGQVNLINSGLKLNTATTSSAQSSMTNSSVTTTTSGTDTSPYCYGVNWIIKL